MIWLQFFEINTNGVAGSPHSLSDMNTSRLNRPSNLRGFTLIELLVTVAIMAVLGAMAFGVAARVKTKANLSASVQRARDLGPILMAYSQDRNGRLPVWKDQESYWWQELVDTEEYDPEQFFKSPGHREFDPDRVEATISYGWNVSVLGRGASDDGVESVSPRRVVNFRRPASVLVLADGAREDGYGMIEPGGPLPDPERYGGKVAGLMLDGSAQIFDAENDFKADSKWFQEAM